MDTNIPSNIDRTMKSKLLKLLALALTLITVSCAPGGLTVNLFPAVPMGGGGGNCGVPQGRPMPRMMPGGQSNCGNPFVNAWNQNGGRPQNPYMPLGGTNNFPGGQSIHPSGYPRAFQSGSQLPYNVSPDPSSRYYAGNYVRDSGGYDPNNGRINYTSGGLTVPAGNFGDRRQGNQSGR